MCVYGNWIGLGWALWGGGVKTLNEYDEKKINLYKIPNGFNGIINDVLFHCVADFFFVFNSVYIERAFLTLCFRSPASVCHHKDYHITVFYLHC